MQSIPCSVIEWSGFYEAWPKASWLNAVDSMHFGAMDPDCMHWSPWSEAQCIPIECSGFFCSMAQSIPIECSGFNAASLNAEDSMHCGVMDPDCMQRSPCSVMTEWIPCSLLKCILIECSGFHAAWLNAVDSMQPGKMHPDWMQWITCSMIECSGFYAAWPKASWLNAVDYVQHDWMQWTPCNVVKCILIECSGFDTA